MEGVGGAACEIGHTVIQKDGRPCVCGRRGCWENYASATALIRMVHEAMEKHSDSLLWEEQTGDPPRVDGRTAFAAARRGDAAARAVVDEYLTWLGEGLANLIAFFQPEMICVGGGVSNAGDDLFPPLRERVNELVCTGNKTENAVRPSEIRKTLLGSDAGIIGAALWGTQYGKAPPVWTGLSRACPPCKIV